MPVSMAQSRGPATTPEEVPEDVPTTVPRKAPQPVLSRNRDVEFLTFVRRYRPRLAGVAYLLHGDADQAERLVQHALATAYLHGQRFLIIAAEQLARTDPRLLRLAWGPRSSRSALVDGPDDQHEQGDQHDRDAHHDPAPVFDNASTTRVLARLDTLDAPARRALVLHRYLGLSVAGTAELLGSTPEEIEASVARSLLKLSDLGSDGRGGPLTMMASIVPPAGDVETAAFADLAHGRSLVRRRRGRRSVLAAAVVAVLLVIGVAVWPDRVTMIQLSGSAADPSATPSGGSYGGSGAGSGAGSNASGAASTCSDPSVPSCRVELTRQWRAEMAGIVTRTLDPKGTYFSGYSFDYDARYDSDAFWQGRDGALGLDVISTRGSTEVFVQLATSRQAAVRCGATTKHPCVRRQMMDFNYFTLTNTSDSRQGVEVQYRPTGAYVITVIVRDTTKGTPLVVGQGQVISMIENPGLVPPKF